MAGKDLPPSIAYCISKGTYLSGSEFYRAHRPVHVLGHQQNWLTFLATHFVLPEKAGESWRINVPFPTEDGGPDERVVTPKVIITRPIWQMDNDTGDTFESVARITESIAYAQEAGQIVIADIDDHPYGWNEEYADKTQNEPISEWGWHDNWLNQCNAVLTSTRWLQDYLGNRFPDQSFAYAPNLYDPFRYEDCQPVFGPRLGAHLFLQARLRSDFIRLGEVLRPILETNEDLTFTHIGEEFKCATCDHAMRQHYEDATYCADCACETYVASGGDSLARFTELDPARIIAKPPCSLMELPEQMDWSVGVIPMADSEYNYAKTEGKGFEMAAAGIPFVALTGEHPLYLQTPSIDERNAATDIRFLTTNQSYWEKESTQVRKWATALAQEHQRDYLAAMDELSRTDLSKIKVH